MNAKRLPATVAMVFAAMLLSSSGLIVRHIEHATGWQIVFFRGSSLIPAILLVYVLRNRGRVISEFRKAGLAPLLAGTLQGLASICFVLAMTRTSVANAMFVLSTVPFFAAGLGWVILRERVEVRTIAAIGASSVGISLVMVDGFISGTTTGNMLALANSILMACFIIVLRRNQNVDMLPAIVVGALIAVFLSTIAVPNFEVPIRDILLCVLWGVGVQCTAQIVTIFAARHLRAAELCLLSLIEFVLGPIWVWLAVGEVPGRYSVMGGAIVMLTIALWSITGAYRLNSGITRAPPVE